MRRLFSIAAITTLLSQLASPLLTPSCPHMKQTTACHRSHQSAQPAHHCGMMMHQDEGNPVASPREAPAVNATRSENCPMDCCAACHVTNIAVIAGAVSCTYSVFYRRSSAFIGAPTGFALERLRDAERVYEKAIRGRAGDATQELHNAERLAHLLGTNETARTDRKLEETKD